MIRKIITAIAFNTIGAAIIVVGARLPSRTAAITVCSLGMGISGSGITLMLLLSEKEIGESHQESIKWAMEAKKLLEEKREWLAKIEALQARIESAEAQYEGVISSLKVDKELIEKMEAAEQN